MSEHITTQVYTLGQTVTDLCNFRLTQSVFKEGDGV